jgi:predicted GH43/DUF377 family glycosyl hydrolase
VLVDFSGRHEKILDFFRERFEFVRPFLLTDQKLSESRELLIGAYFTHEYSLESAALFNPSIIPHPDQTDLPKGAYRFIVSLRATGEGHISSITFRTGVIDANDSIAINTPTRFVTEPKRIPNASYDKLLLEHKLAELGVASDFVRLAFKPLNDTFTIEELRHSVSLAQRTLRGRTDAENDFSARAIMTLARSNYEVQFTADQRVSERVIFPTSPSQSNGIEDARFVLFTNDDGTQTYYASYTAFDGKVTFPQLLETDDFLHFRFLTLNGPAVQNKGMALFPKKIKGQFAMISRQDNENIFLMYSDNIHFWHTAQPILKPTQAWEFVQLGNCGSPMETEAGWLVLSHGVGAMRKYCIGAFLLDRDDPSKVIGRLREPLLKPTDDEREGYVPNVVYSCGALIHRDTLIIPYAMSDYASRFATVKVKDVLAAME